MGLQIVNGRIEALEIKALGLSIRRKAMSSTGTLRGISESRSLAWFWPTIREACAGAWQRNEEIPVDNVLSNPTLYACITLIASDIAKMRPRLMEIDPDGIWSEIDNPAYSALLREPNHFQTWDAFIEWWVTSKLVTGNTYSLKQRDARGVVSRMYVLDPNRVKVLVAPDGSVFYELVANDQDLSQQKQTVIVPAREIIHDVMSPLFHPLLGVSPIFAAGFSALVAKHGLNNTKSLFANGSQPGGIITAPGHISEPDAIRLKQQFEDGYTGDNYGRVAVLGDQLAYTPMGTVRAADSQLIETLKWTDEQIAKCFHMPLFKVGGPYPPYDSVDSVNQIYYADCLQTKTVRIEKLLNKGLDLVRTFSISFDVEDLNRMDSATLMETTTKGISGGVFTPNDGRKSFNKKPLKGGDTVYLQEQDHSLAWLAERDRMQPAAAVAPAAALPVPEPPDDGDAEDELKSFEVVLLRKMFDLSRQHGA